MRENGCYRVPIRRLFFKIIFQISKLQFPNEMIVVGADRTELELRHSDE